MIGYYSQLSLFGEIIESEISTQLLPFDYKLVKPGKWIKEDHDQYKKGMEVYSLGSKSKVLIWGVSLNFCPTFNGKMTWHRTAKSADISDICFDPVDYEDPRKCTLSPFDFTDRKDLCKAVQKRTQEAIQESDSFYKKIKELNDLEILYKEKKGRKAVRFGFEYYPQHLLSYAFLLRKIGKEDLSKNYFEKFLNTAGKEYDVSELVDTYERLTVEKTRA